MKSWYIVSLLCLSVSSQALAWGQEGHSIVGEIAQRRLTEAARNQVAKILGNGVSLASIANWADDARETRPQTSNWHFVNIPINDSAYDAAVHCKASPKGDCVVAAVNRLKDEIHCAPTDAEKADALRFVVHFLGDIHQPLHTVEEARGGNDVRALAYIGGATCTGTCNPAPAATNLHAAWDSILIQKASWNWGSLTNQIEAALPPDTSQSGSANPKDWAEETHRVAQQIWAMTPKNGVLDEEYYLAALPVAKKQLGIAGLRLARLLNDAFGGAACPPPNKS